MRLNDLVRMSVGYAIRQRRRLGPSLVGVAIGTAALVVVLVGAATIAETSSNQVLGQGSLRRISVTPTNNSPDHQITSSTLASFHGLSHVTAVYPTIRVAVAGHTTRNDYVVSLLNVPPAQDRPTLVGGGWGSNDQIVVPDAGLPDKTGRNAAGQTLLGTSIVLQVHSLQGLGQGQEIPVTVSGVYHASSDATASDTYADLALVQHVLALMNGKTDQAFNASASFAEAIVDVDQPQNTAGVARLIDGQGFVTSYVEQQVQGLSTRLQSLETVAAALLIGILALSALSIGNFLANSVLQRRRELAILLAVGLSERTVATMVAGEGVATGLAGGILGGLVAGVGLAVFHLFRSDIALQIPWLSLVPAIGAGVLLSFGASLLPARRVFSMDVVQALREE